MTVSTQKLIILHYTVHSLNLIGQAAFQVCRYFTVTALGHFTVRITPQKIPLPAAELLSTVVLAILSVDMGYDTFREYDVQLKI